MCASGLRFLGFLNRRPYLWIIDVDDRAVYPAGADVPVRAAINRILPREGWIGAICGPDLLALPPDLKSVGGKLGYSFAMVPGHDRRVVWVLDPPRGGENVRALALDPHATDGVREARALPPWTTPVADTAEGLIVRGTSLLVVPHDGSSAVTAADYSWTTRQPPALEVDVFGAAAGIAVTDLRLGVRQLYSDESLPQFGLPTLSPDAQAVAAPASPEPMRTIRPFDGFDSRTYTPTRSVLVLIDLGSNSLTVCEGVFFDHSAPPAWSADSATVAVVGNADPKKLYLAARDDHYLHAVTFRRHVPSPLLDAALVGVA